MNFKIRRADHADAAGIIHAHRCSIREICSDDYTEEQIAIWSGRDFKEGIWHETIDKDTVEVIVDASEAVFGFCHHGYTSKEKKINEIKGLYLRPQALGKGFGSKLVSNAVDHSTANGCTSIILYSTKTAQPFYEYQGFSLIAERSIEMQGVKLPCLEMSMALEKYV